MPTLSQRLGVTCHESPLRRKLERLQCEFSSSTANCLEDWLMDVANARGAQVVVRPTAPTTGFIAPSLTRLSNEELVAGICQFQCLDRPQMLRLAAQLVSQRAVEPARLCLIAKRERVERVLAALAREALRVEAHHAVWTALWQEFHNVPPVRDVLLHWTRLAEPVMNRNAPNAAAWKLAA
jgi:hypothetical protein